VTPGSPAHKIGLKNNDVITEIGDVSTDNMTAQEASEYISQFGDTIILTIERSVTSLSLYFVP
jgi:S1-C subfamily serine protease